MSEIKKILKEGETTTSEAGTQEKPDITSLEQSLEEQKNARTKDAERIASLEFDNSFKDIVAELPDAKEARDEIRDKVKANPGMSVSDAAYAVLGSKGKFKHQSSDDDGSSFGGSGSTTVAGSKAKKSREELAKEFQDAEARGEIKLV
jgi:hypothetical protein